MKLKCLLVDDEPLALEILESYIGRMEGLEVVATANNAMDAFAALQQYTVDLMFLDIQMPKLTGIDFLKTLKHPPKVIFTTAYRDYALEGYELDVLDYLLKPISFERFMKAVGKAFTQPQGGALAAAPVAEASADEPYFYVKEDKRNVKVQLRDILYIESLKDYVRVVTTQKEVITHQKISYLEEVLPEERFLRVHRSYMVAKDKIETYNAESLEIGSHELPIGRNYKQQVLAELNRQRLE